jgi:integrase
MAKSQLKLIAPTGENPTVRTPRRRKNAAREHLTQREVECLIEATTSHRDATMVLLAFRHGLRASELVDLRWEQVDFAGVAQHVRMGLETELRPGMLHLPTAIKRARAGGRHAGGGWRQIHRKRAGWAPIRNIRCTLYPVR